MQADRIVEWSEVEMIEDIFCDAPDHFFDALDLFFTTNASTAPRSKGSGNEIS